MSYFGLLDAAVVVLLFLFSLLIGLFYAWKDRGATTEEFLSGGKRLKTLPVAFSIIVSWTSAQTLIGYPVEVYTRGTQITSSLVIAFLSTYISAETFLPVFHKVGIISVNTYLEKRFQSPTLTRITSAITNLSYIPYLGVVLYSPALSLSVIGDMPVTTSILVTGIVVMVYSALGGLKAVVWTDVFQGVLMILAILIVLVKGTMTVGGIQEVFRRCRDGGRLDLFNFDFNPYMSNNFWTVIVGNFFLWVAFTSIDQIIIQRSCNLPSMKQTKRSIHIATLGFSIITLCVIYLGMVMYANYYKCDPSASGQVKTPDQIVTLFVGQMFSSEYPGFTGLFVAGLFSSSLSTLSSGYNALSALIWEDWLKTLLPPMGRKSALLVTKLVGFGVGSATLAAAFLSMNVATIFEAGLLLSCVPYGPVYGIFFLGMFFPFVNAKGALIATLCAQLVGAWLVGGALLNGMDPNVQLTLATSTEECVGGLNNTKSVPFSSLKHIKIPNYTPVGLNKIYHISPFILPIVTFLVTIGVGIFASIATGGNEHPVDPDHMIPFALNTDWLFPKKTKKCAMAQKSSTTKEITKHGNSVKLKSYKKSDPS